MSESEQPIAKPVNLSMQRKSSARLLAVQYLYQQALDAETVGIETFLQQTSEAQLLEGGKHEDGFALMPKVAPDTGFLRKMLQGLESEKAAVESLLMTICADKPRAFVRLSALIKSLLICGTYELVHHQNLKPAILLNEYVTLAARFFDPPELGYINGILQEAAGRARPL